MSQGEQPVIFAPTAEEIDKVRGYSIEKWGRFDNYCCVYCRYKTLWIEKMNKHLDKGNHPWPYAAKRDGKAPLSPYKESELAELDY
jgi:hypothetical protein